MENGLEGSLPPQQTETSAPAIGIPVTETPAETQKGFVAWIKRKFGSSKNEPMAVGSGMAEQLPEAGQQLDSGTPNATDFATASTATVPDVGSGVDASATLDDLTKQMSAQVTNPMPGIPSMPMVKPVASTIETPATAPTPESAPLVPPTTDKAA